jgi:hypothetical protein
MKRDDLELRSVNGADGWHVGKWDMQPSDPINRKYEYYALRASQRPVTPSWGLDITARETIGNGRRVHRDVE